ncbi:MAG TPA: radical SAM protein [Thermoanaerobaculia bacterium]|nr:radical SAM protein [Thermoanaerobaculia bacterium]
MPKLLLIVPPCFIGRELDFEIGFPVHLVFLARSARLTGWNVDYLDMTLEEKEGHDSFAILGGLLSDRTLCAVGISNHTVRTSITTRAVAERVKAQRPELKIIVGGVNSTFMWRELLETCPEIDYVLRGYGQRGLGSLLAFLDAGAPLRAPGLAYRTADGVSTLAMESVAADDFAVPLIEDLPVGRYLEWTRTYPLLTHTGCGFSCNFCTSVMPGPYQSREVYRDVKDVIREMTMALDAGFERFFVSDNIFTSQREKALLLCRAMSGVGIPRRTTWVCMTRVELVDEELLRAMRAAGCVNVAFGVETAGRRGWTDLRKGRYSEDVIMKAFRLTRAAGIGTTAYLMLGLPSQTAEDIEETIELVRVLDPDYRVVSFFQPFPGTAYWNDPQEFGLSEIVPLEDWNFHEEPVCRTAHLGKADLLRAATRLYLDRGSARAAAIDVDHDSLVWRSDSSAMASLPEPVSDAFRLCDGSLTITGILNRCHQQHGSRGRLIALYWLSSALADGTMDILFANCDMEVRNGV